MSTWGLPFVVLLVVGAGSVGFTRLLNRQAIRSADEARKALEQHATSLPSNDVDAFLASCQLNGKEAEAGRRLLQLLAALLHVPMEKLVGNYQMRELFRVLNGGGSHKAIEPLSYELVEGIAALSDKRRWQERWKERPDLPRNEDKLADLIMQMTIGELLKFFAPLVRV